MAPEIVARFTALMTKPKIMQRPAGINPKWPLRDENINQLWRWDTLEDVEL